VRHKLVRNVVCSNRTEGRHHVPWLQFDGAWDSSRLSCNSKSNRNVNFKFGISIEKASGHFNFGVHPWLCFNSKVLLFTTDQNQKEIEGLGEWRWGSASVPKSNLWVWGKPSEFNIREVEREQLVFYQVFLDPTPYNKRCPSKKHFNTGSRGPFPLWFFFWSWRKKHGHSTFCFEIKQHVGFNSHDPKLLEFNSWGTDWGHLM